MDGAEPGAADRVDAKNCGADKRKTAMSMRNASSSASPQPRHRGGSGVSAWAVGRVRSGTGRQASVSVTCRCGVVIENFGVAPTGWRFRAGGGIRLAEVFVEEVAENSSERVRLDLALSACSIWRSKGTWRERLCGKSLCGLECRPGKRLAFRVMTASLLRHEEASRTAVSTVGVAHRPRDSIHRQGDANQRGLLVG